MTRRLLISATACALGAAVVALTTGGHAALETLALLAAVSAFALVAGALARGLRSRSRALSRLLALAVAIAVGAILAAVGLAASVMFISAEDALIVSVMAAVIAVVGMCVAGLITDPAVRDIEHVRDRLRSVGLGSRRADLVTGARDELAELATAANAMIEALAHEEAARASAEQSRRSLITAVSHDLRTPLSALQVLTEAVQDRIVSGATRERYLRQMQVHLAALAGLIDDLFELSRTQRDTLAPTSEPTELGELASETVAAMRATAERNGVRLHFEPPAGQAHGQLLAARADPRQIRRVLLNLLDNAIRHSPEGGDVHVRASRRGDNVQVDVIDEGTGIAPGDAEKVFEPFYRGGGEGGSRQGEGAGLGLAIARAILDAHRGEIWIAPSEMGTTVCFALPALPGRRRAEPRGEDAKAEQVTAG